MSPAARFASVRAVTLILPASHSAGKYPTQTPFAPADSLENWMKGDRSIANEDIVVWYTFGATQ